MWRAGRACSTESPPPNPGRASCLVGRTAEPPRTPRQGPPTGQSKSAAAKRLSRYLPLVLRRPASRICASTRPEDGSWAVQRNGDASAARMDGVPLPKPFPPPPPGLRFYPICASATRRWAGSRSSWPGPAGKRPSLAEKSWLEARGSAGARSRSCSERGGPGCSVPARHRARRTLTTRQHPHHKTPS